MNVFQLAFRLFICTLLFSCTSNGDNELRFEGMSIDTSSEMQYDKISKTSYDLSQHLSKFLIKEDSASVFQFDTISKIVFSKYLRAYNPKINTDTSNIIRTDTTFSVTTANSCINFPADQRNELKHFTGYVGFLEPLNLFVLQDIDGHNEVGTLLLLDGITGKRFYFESPFDEPYETVKISPKDQYLLAYANTWYEHDHSFISILKIKKDGTHYKLKDFAGSYMNNTLIEEAVWIDETNFALSVVEKIISMDEVSGERIQTGEKHYFLKASFTE
jgi:hypothetical protein